LPFNYSKVHQLKTTINSIQTNHQPILVPNTNTQYQYPTQTGNSLVMLVFASLPKANGDAAPSDAGAARIKAMQVREFKTGQAKLAYIV
jgi:hypothetical protein